MYLHKILIENILKIKSILFDWEIFSKDWPVQSATIPVARGYPPLLICICVFWFVFSDLLLCSLIYVCVFWFVFVFVFSDLCFLICCCVLWFVFVFSDLHLCFLICVCVFWFPVVFCTSGPPYYCHYCYLYNSYKSPFKLSDWNPRHPIQRLQQTTHQTGVKLLLGWIFDGYSLRSSRDFTEVRPVLAAGGHLVNLLEPSAELLETDLGTLIKLFSINIFIKMIGVFFDIFHVMWPSDSNPGAKCISKLDEWETALFIVF